MSAAPTRERRGRSLPTAARLAVSAPQTSPEWRGLLADADAPIDAPVQRSIWLHRTAGVDLWWRLKFRFLRALEAVVRWIVIERSLRIEARQAVSFRSTITDTGVDLGRRQLSLGHGCPGPDLLVGSAEASRRVASHDPASRPIEVCVVGNGTAAIELIRRLLAQGSKVHATAETVDDYVLLRAEGALPHRFEDLPAVAIGLDVLISTSLSWFVGAHVVARLPERAVIVDTVGPPGSVDFETSQRLGRTVLWERDFLVSSLSGTSGETWQRILTLICKQRLGSADSQLSK
ncbi:MAG TPA: hypothetical protein VGC77_14620 [Rhodopseudomonas sp.]|uniref:hypothetical protein n=1 Tax=Rhodopseudomonas sp. TaxID=1078 RepID=UPI002ED82111